jgi:hypothetical protein
MLMWCDILYIRIMLIELLFLSENALVTKFVKLLYLC